MSDEEDEKIYFRRQTDETQRIITVAVQQWMDDKWAELGKCGASWVVKLFGYVCVSVFGALVWSWFSLHAPNLKALISTPGMP